MSAADVLAADIFADLVRELHRGPSAPMTVDGSVDFSNCCFENDLVFRDITFRGNFIAANARFRSIRFSDCRFERGLLMGGCRSSADVVLDNCAFVENESGKQAIRLTLDSCRIEGTLQFIGKLDVHGAVHMEHAVIDGDLQVEALEIRGFDSSPEQVSLSLDGITVGGSVTLGSKGGTTRGDFPGKRKTSSEIASAMSCRHMDIGHSFRILATTRFGGALQMNASEIAGDLEISGDTEFEAGATFRTMEIGGSFNVSSPQKIVGDFNLSGSKIEGDFGFGGNDRCTLRGDFLGNQMSVNNATIQNIVFAGEEEEDQKRARKKSDGENRNPIPRQLSLYRAVCRSSLGLAMIQDCAKISLIGAEVRFIISIRGVNMGRGWADPGVKSVISFDSVKADGQIQLDWLNAVDLISINYGEVHSVTMGYEGANQVGSLYMQEATIASVFVVYATRFFDTRRTDDVTPGVFIRSCKFGSFVSFWPRRVAQQKMHCTSRWHENARTTVHSNLSIIQCRIAGDLDLTRVRIGDDRAGTAGNGGAVTLDRTICEGDILFASALSVRERQRQTAVFDDELEEVINAEPVVPAPPEEPGEEARFTFPKPTQFRPEEYFDRAILSHLSMFQTRAVNIDLSGLRLREPDPAIEGADGALVATGLNVSQRLSLAITTEDGRSAARIPRALKLMGAEIGTLHLTNDDFSGALKEGEPDNASAIGIVLERATVGTLHVPRDGACEGPHCFPRPLDLAGLTVRHWLFNEDPLHQPEANDFLDFLDNDEVIHRELYRSVSALLRNSGHDGEAEEVDFAEEYRMRWEPKGYWQKGHGRLHRNRWRIPVRAKGERAQIGMKTYYDFMVWRPVDGIKRRVSQYYRNPVPIGFFILALMATSMLAAFSPSNFELSDSARQTVALEEQAHPVDAKAVWRGTGAGTGISAQKHLDALGPPDEDWGPLDGAWAIVRYHVPIISLAVRDDYVATDDNPLRLAGVDMPFFTAEDWFTAMSILNWLMWPVFLTFLFRKLLRDR